MPLTCDSQLLESRNQKVGYGSCLYSIHSTVSVTQPAPPTCQSHNLSRPHANHKTCPAHLPFTQPAPPPQSYNRPRPPSNDAAVAAHDGGLNVGRVVAEAADAEGLVQRAHDVHTVHGS